MTRGPVAQVGGSATAAREITGTDASSPAAIEVEVPRAAREEVLVLDFGGQ